MSDGTPFRILFVCTGNTCRSPLAEALARRGVDERGWSGLVEVGSAGAATAGGSSASEGSLEAGRSVGLDLAEHRSTPLTPALVAQQDLILTMGPGHLHSVLSMGGEGRAALLSAFAEGVEDRELGWGVPDPFGGSLELYMETLRVIDQLVVATLDRLEPLIHPTDS